ERRAPAPERTEAVPPPPRTVEPTRARWPYAAAAVLALAIGLRYALLPPTLPREEPAATPRTEQEAKPATKEAPAPTLPVLAWQTVTPAAGEAVTVKEGERLRFQASVASPDAQPGLDVRWLLDGREVGQGVSWEYAPGFTEGGHTRSVEAVATSEGRRLEQGWQVTVTDVDRPPVIASVSPPEGTVPLARGTAQKFALQATDPDD